MFSASGCKASKAITWSCTTASNARRGIGFERRQLGIGAYQFVAEPGGQKAGTFGAFARIDEALAVAKTADLAEHELQPRLRLPDLRLGMAYPVAPPPQ